MRHSSRWVHVIVSPVLMLGLCCCAAGADWAIDRPRPGVLVLRNDTGAWGGFSMGVSHMNHPEYQARKSLDLTALPRDAVSRSKAARLRMYFAIQDYSWAHGGQHNGLNEAFEVDVNGHVLRFDTKDPRFPAKSGQSDPLRADWVDIDVPVEWIHGDVLTVIIRKAHGGSNDDYIYPGIDNTVPNTNSAVTFDGGETWETGKLNTIDAQGEYIVRLVLSENELRTHATWRPPREPTDPAGLLAFHEAEGRSFRLELHGDAYDRFRPLLATVRFRGTQPVARWLAADGKDLAGATTMAQGAVQHTLAPGQWQVQALAVDTPDGSTVDELDIEFELPTTPPKPIIDLCPDMAAPRGARAARPPHCRREGDRAILDNGAMRAEFRIQPKLELLSLRCAETDRDVLAHPEYTHLFRLKIGDSVYGCRDGEVTGFEMESTGFGVTVSLADTGVQCRFRAAAEPDELRVGLEVRNHGDANVQFHAAFPHLAGLQLSADSAADYYLFPWGGGIIADAPASLRTAYGENTCWWQMIDLFSPARGGGIYLRCDDSTGLYKCPALRKGESMPADFSLDETGSGYLRPEMQWKNALDPAPGLALAFDYLRRDRGPGRSFKVPDACIGTHAGDWRNAMHVYADWARRTWPPRPYPSKLTTCWHIVAPGWGQSPLFKDGEYRTDYITPRNDVAEMMSWWSWSDKGPWATAMDKLEEELGSKLFKRYESYWVKEPASGKMMYPLNRGDYDGYMSQWGGLPALRAHIERVRTAGGVPMFYTDPILACANTKLGSTYGPTHGIMNPDWKDGYECPKTPPGYVGSYGSYNMCLDTEWYSAWVAQTMARVCRETGVDGVRLDEYGHRGYVCRSDRHEHIFAELGHNAWLQALARNVRQVHAAMDKVRPGLLLTTEFPGHDCMAAALEGAIVYDVRRTRPIRPTPINLFRFFFPECKAFEINRPARREAHAWMTWNAVGAFSALYPECTHAMLKENNDAFTSRNAEPLVPTLVRRVYANRFEGGQKSIVTVHNATGHTVDAPVLAVGTGGEVHFVDLLRGQELVPAASEYGTAISLRLRRDETRVLARLPKILALRDGRVQLPPAETGTEITATDARGRRVAAFANGAVLTAPQDAAPVLLKLLRDGLLRDALPWPRASSR